MAVRKTSSESKSHLAIRCLALKKKENTGRKIALVIIDMRNLLTVNH